MNTVEDNGHGTAPSATGRRSGAAELHTALGADASAFPFRCELSLDPLIDFWTAPPPAEGPARTGLGRIVAEEIGKAPALRGTITDPSVFDRHRELVDVLMGAVFPPAAREQEFGAALMPFQLRGVYATPPMRRLLLSADGTLRATGAHDEPPDAARRIARAYALILRRLYGIAVELEEPLLHTLRDDETGLDRHFRLFLDSRFETIVCDGAAPPLSAELRQYLQANLLNPAALRQALPPDPFRIRGFTILRAVEVTDQEVLSALKRDLIDRASIVAHDRFLGLQDRLRTLFRRPALRLGLAAIDGSRVLLLNAEARHQYACIYADSRHYRTADLAGSVHARAIDGKEPLFVPDLSALPRRTAVEEDALRAGIRTMVVAPLHYQGKVIGTLALGSPQPGDLDATHLPKLQEVLPLFAMAVQRSMGELNNRIQGQIKEKFTAIHPVVEWRFRQAVLAGLERQCDPAGLELAPIAFEGVYPLYALSDIRASSTERMRAIQADLLAQLQLARDVVAAAHQARPLPALDELRYRIAGHAAHVEGGLASGDEVGVIGFLRADVERLFEHLQGFGADVGARIEAYRAALDPRRGAVYRRRQLYEESVTRITETIAAYLDREERAAQAMYPHYFERRETDGVDHQIYVGASLVEDGRLDPLYLKNLRLWQLMVVCGIAARADALTARLPVPLQTTHLVLVQHAPLAIRFRFDEKRFDVAGAYDIRYEIVKKRIDKAVVRGGSERVTQPGKIAIVYAQPAEGAEYRSYVDYLQHRGYLGQEVEDLELAELQGVHGLRALRVMVTLSTPPPDEPSAGDARPQQAARAA